MPGYEAYSIAMLHTAERAEREPAWSEYAQYCRQRERGVRRDALRHLKTFLQAAARWPRAERRTFVAWLCGEIESLGDEIGGILPHPLASRLLSPTLAEWIREEPDAVLPQRWLGLLLSGREYQGVRAGLGGMPAEPNIYLLRALELDPAEQPARVRLAPLHLAALDWDTHHLPVYYIGDPDEDLAAADEAARLIEGVTDAVTRAHLRADLTASRRLIEDWIVFQRESGTDFDEWCRLRGREHQWRIHYYYDPDAG